MYIQDVHILYYLLIGILGLGVGQLLDWLTIRVENHEKILSREFFIQYCKNLKLNIFTMYTTSILYISLLYIYGISLKFVFLLIIVPILLSALIVDYRKQIIPNRLNLLIFQISLIYTFILGFCDFNIFINKWLGLLFGGGIFLLITLIGGLIAGKEAMGFGDVKLMTALGLFFGWKIILIITIISFLLGSIISIILLITKKKKNTEYIPFGPFIVLSTFITILVPSKILLLILFKIFTLGMY